MRFIFTLLIIGGLGYGGFWLDKNHPELTHKVKEWVHTGSLPTIEPRYSPHQIMEKQQLSVSTGSEYNYNEFLLVYHPYLLMEVKYTTQEFETEEKVILWDLLDGEMVIDTKSWEKTHGFADCINAGADRREYQLLMAIARNGGTADRQTLMASLNLDPHLSEGWIDRACQKNLLVKQGNLYRIHLSQPLLSVPPSTSIQTPLVTKSSKLRTRIPKRFTSSQIKRAANAAFGTNFAIRHTHEVYLPVYLFTVQNQDGTLQTTHWNGLNGEKISYSHAP